MFVLRPGYKFLALLRLAVVEAVDLEYEANGHKMHEIIAHHIIQHSIPASTHKYETR